MFRKALVPLDGTELAEGILPYISQIAIGMDMPLVLLTVIDADAFELPSRLRSTGASQRTRGRSAGQGDMPGPPDGRPYSQVFDVPQERALDRLESVAKELKGQGVRAQPLVKFGSPADEIVKAARSEGCDLIAMSTHGRNPLGRAILGSVTDKVIHSSTIPTLTITPERAREYRDQKDIIDKVLVPLDGSPLSEKALPYVEALAARMSLEVLVVRVLTVDTLHKAFASGYADTGDPAKEVDRYVTDYLKGVAERLKQKGIKADWKILWGHPAASIVDLAQKVPQDIIALSTRGRSGITRWALGSVAESVIRVSGHPVLVIPPEAYA